MKARGFVESEMPLHLVSGSTLREDQIVRRRDEIASRRRWQFGLRDELVALSTKPAEGND